MTGDTTLQFGREDEKRSSMINYRFHKFIIGDNEILRFDFIGNCSFYLEKNLLQLKTLVKKFFKLKKLFKKIFEIKNII